MIFKEFNNVGLTWSSAMTGGNTDEGLEWRASKHSNVTFEDFSVCIIIMTSGFA
jgi:hypothetical protein